MPNVDAGATKASMEYIELKGHSPLPWTFSVLTLATPTAFLVRSPCSRSCHSKDYIILKYPPFCARDL